MLTGIPRQHHVLQDGEIRRALAPVNSMFGEAGSIAADETLFEDALPARVLTVQASNFLVGHEKDFQGLRENGHAGLPDDFKPGLSAQPLLQKCRLFGHDFWIEIRSLERRLFRFYLAHSFDERSCNFVKVILDECGAFFEKKIYVQCVYLAKNLGSLVAPTDEARY